MVHKIAVIGLGYVGLPLAYAFSEKYQVIGYDHNSTRINELEKGFDSLNQLSISSLKKRTKRLNFTDNPKFLSDYNTFIITVPTPITEDKKPDLSFLINASAHSSLFLNGKSGNKPSYVLTSI